MSGDKARFEGYTLDCLKRVGAMACTRFLLSNRQYYLMEPKHALSDRMGEAETIGDK